jgi:lipid A 4'-phosphatase
MDFRAWYRPTANAITSKRKQRAHCDEAAGEAAFGMQYLKMGRSQVILVSFVLFSLLAAAFPSVDIAISRLFFHDGFPRDQWWQSLLHVSLNGFLGLSLGLVVTLYAVNRVFGTKICNVDGRRVVYLFLVLIVGAGLIVNLTLKDNFGRARPRDVTEFGGTRMFTPAFVMSHECRTNCSFSSGDAAGGFFSLALVFALAPRRRRFLLAALAVGGIESLARISSGAHFFSDTGVSFFVMLIVADVLYFYVVLSRAERTGKQLSTGVAPAFVAAVADPAADARTGGGPGI